MKTTLYIYDPKTFKGTILTSCPFVDLTKPDGKTLLNATVLHYSDGLTFAQYNEQHGGGLIAQTWDEFWPVLEKYNTETYVKPWREITEEQYYDSLECLPPCKWHDLNNRFNSFFISEAWTADLHSFCIKDRKTGKYYSATRSRFISDSDLIKDLISQLGV
jgi:hypothetical protein